MPKPPETVPGPASSTDGKDRGDPIDPRARAEALLRDKIFLKTLRGPVPRLADNLRGWLKRSDAVPFAALASFDRARRLLGIFLLPPRPGNDAKPALSWNRDELAPTHDRRFDWAGIHPCRLAWFQLPPENGNGGFHLDSVSVPVWRNGKPLAEITTRDLETSPEPPSNFRSLLLWPFRTLYDIWFIRTLARDATRKRYENGWLFVDRDGRADDNAEHFYRWMAHHHPDRPLHFALRRNSPDWPRLAAEGFRLLDIASAEYRRAHVLAEWVVSSHVNSYATRVRWRRRYRRFGVPRFAFLQHGVTKDYVPAFNRVPIDFYAAAAPAEYRAFAEDPRWAYPLSSKETALTGFPRHDALLTRTAPARTGPEKKRYLLAVPTWRKRAEANCLFTRTRRFASPVFLQPWRDLLVHPALTEAARKHGLEIRLLPHPLIWTDFKEFAAAGITVFSPEEGTWTDALTRCALLVTDYSSVAFDAALAGARVLYFQFDRKTFFSENQYRTGYFDYRRDGFGPVAPTVAEAAEQAVGLLENGMSAVHRERIAAFFGHYDANSCQRVYEALRVRSGDRP